MRHPRFRAGEVKSERLPGWQRAVFTLISITLQVAVDMLRPAAWALGLLSLLQIAFNMGSPNPSLIQTAEIWLGRTFAFTTESWHDTKDVWLGPYVLVLLILALVATALPRAAIFRNLVITVQWTRRVVAAAAVLVSFSFFAAVNLETQATDNLIHARLIQETETSKKRHVFFDQTATWKELRVKDAVMGSIRQLAPEERARIRQDLVKRPPESPDTISHLS